MPQSHMTKQQLTIRDFLRRMTEHFADDELADGLEIWKPNAGDVIPRYTFILTTGDHKTMTTIAPRKILDSRLQTSELADYEYSVLQELLIRETKKEQPA